MSTGHGLIWIQGAGELASAVGMRLARCGYQVALAEIENPLAVRRLVAFSEAVYEGKSEVEGVPGVLVKNWEQSVPAGVVRVMVDPRAGTLPLFNPSAVIDARMTKRPPEPLPAQGVPLIGIGPGFRVGRDCDLIIETHRGARMGSVLRQGEAMDNTGIPGVVGGQSARRVVYAPCAGQLEPRVKIGDLVDEGDLLGSVAGQPVVSRLPGLVRGLVHRRAELSSGEKVGDIDPRGPDVDPALVTDKGLAIAGGVLEALLSSGIWPDH